MIGYSEVDAAKFEIHWTGGPVPEQFIDKQMCESRASMPGAGIFIGATDEDRRLWKQRMKVR